jgi:hypothetical protein
VLAYSGGDGIGTTGVIEYSISADPPWIEHQETNMKNVLSALAIGLFTLTLGGGAYAASDEYKAAKKQEEANYKMAKAECEKMKGSEEDKCEKRVKTDHEAAEEKLKAMK